MNGLMAAVKFLSETINAASPGCFVLAFSAQEPESGTNLGEFAPSTGLSEGYYLLSIVSPDGTPLDDFGGYWHVTSGGV